ncbi:GntR family transcriptional regulator [Ruoffia tabacinasalis]|jgi:DNA-binding GntR family transcriptional regulator|uniref:GntR family transcriptional regulator n=1 Tax=Ruoffia tabacinasalis TaxID=87458 RepID=A0A5R9EJ74_9LACT|nr:GntR family transcriptional regulator [Ruoffia tabacinasalis]MBG9977191.1 GntR family transcriptional regulator [Ruoffia tabacinasalis]TLQ48990.1 GntR family transcriptional regulator [Ruoffia tabacinasalis]HJG47999.1 GntR family transcriptional regulator [Ruoffia tabacinasalis]
MDSTVEAVKANLDINSNQTLKVSVYHAFKRTIILGEIPAGERINESVFSEEMNISRTPIRYALEQLLKEELVEHVPGIGMIVRGISIKDAYEIYDIRKALDTLAFTKAMHLMTEEDFDELERHLQSGDSIQTKESDDRIDNLINNFSGFNAYVYEKSQMRRLPKIIDELQAYLVYFRELSIRSEVRSKIALEEHFLILRGMRNKDVETMTMLIHEHLDHSLKFIIEDMENRNIG